MHHGCKIATALGLLTLMWLAPSAARAGDGWAVGVGFNFASGFSVREPGNLVGIVAREDDSSKRAWDVVPDLEIAAFELRLFPKDDRFSIDLQWYVLQTILGLVQKELPAAVPIYTQNTYFHLRKDPQARATFAVAPGVTFAAGNLLLTKFISFGAVCRIGVDVHGPERKFAMGFYARPSISLNGLENEHSPYSSFPPEDYVKDPDKPLEHGPAVDLLFEVTWTFHAFRK